MVKNDMKARSHKRLEFPCFWMYGWRRINLVLLLVFFMLVLDFSKRLKKRAGKQQNTILESSSSCFNGDGEKILRAWERMRKKGLI